jgi:hypothetical protein
MSGASSNDTTQTAKKRIASGPDPPPPSSEERRRPPPHQAAPSPVGEKQNRPDERRHDGHDADVVIAHVRELVRHDALQLFPGEGLDEARSDRDRGLLRPRARRKSVGIGVGNDIDGGLGHAGRDRHLLDNVVERPLLRVARIDGDGVGGLEHRLIAAREGPPRGKAAQAQGPERRDRDPRSDSRTIEKGVRSHAEKCQEEDEPEKDRPRAALVTPLLVVEINGSHEVSGEGCQGKTGVRCQVPGVRDGGLALT